MGIAPAEGTHGSGPLAIGCAAGFGGDRTDAAGPVVDTLDRPRRSRRC